MWWVPVSLLFCTSLLGKVFSDRSLTDFLVATRMFPRPLAGALGLLIPRAEGLAVLLLVRSTTRRSGWALSGGLAVGFVLFHGLALGLRDIEPCACLGPPLLGNRVADHLVMGGLGLGVFVLALRATMAYRRSARVGVSPRPAVSPSVSAVSLAAFGGRLIAGEPTKGSS